MQQSFSEHASRLLKAWLGLSRLRCSNCSSQLFQRSLGCAWLLNQEHQCDHTRTGRQTDETDRQTTHTHTHETHTHETHTHTHTRNTHTHTHTRTHTHKTAHHTTTQLEVAPMLMALAWCSSSAQTWVGQNQLESPLLSMETKYWACHRTTHVQGQKSRRHNNMKIPLPPPKNLKTKEEGRKDGRRNPKMNPSPTATPNTPLLPSQG